MLPQLLPANVSLPEMEVHRANLGLATKPAPAGGGGAVPNRRQWERGRPAHPWLRPSGRWSGPGRTGHCCPGLTRDLRAPPDLRAP